MTKLHFQNFRINHKFKGISIESYTVLDTPDIETFKFPT